MITFFDRLASATDLPGLICKKHGVPAVLFYVKRTGFWRGEIHLEPLSYSADPLQITLLSHAWLERYLSASDDACADWLWVHERWKTHQRARRRLHWHPKKSFLEEQNKFLGRAQIPRRTRLWVRMPNWLGDTIMALSLIRLLPAARPDAEITLFVQKPFIPLLEKLAVADHLIALPLKGRGYFSFFRKLQSRYADTMILFTNSFRGDLEAWLSATPQRFGMLRPGRSRPLLTDWWQMPAGFDEAQHHQTKVWEQYLNCFGFREKLDFTPFSYEADSSVSPDTMGVICGTENTPEKRWPIDSWRQFIKGMLESDKEKKIILFGTAHDQGITRQVKKGLDSERVIDLAGKTDLLEFAAKLKACRFIVCNDTGGMHLANALGVTVVAIFGPTNPIRTGPVFTAPRHILQPPQCPPTGGSPIAQVSIQRVLEVARSLWRSPPTATFEFKEPLPWVKRD